MKTFKNLLVLFAIVFVPLQLAAANEFTFTPVSKSNLSSPLTNKTKERRQFPYKQIVSFYPVKALSNYMMAGYERQIGPKHVLKLAVGYTSFEDQNFNSGFNNYELKNFSGTRFDLMFKYFVGKDATMFNGIYFAPFLSFKNSNFKYQDFNNFDFNTGTSNDVWEEGSATSMTAGFIFGLHVPVTNGFCADFYVGDAKVKSSGDYKQAYRFMDSYRNSIGLISGFSVGFGF